MYSFSLREQGRIKVYYGRGVFENISVEELRSYAMPSFNKYVDRLRKSDREKFYKLQSESILLDTYVPNVGYKVKHKYSDDIVYVIDGERWGEGRMDIDPTRERALIARRCETTWNWCVGSNRMGTAAYLQSRQHQARWCYVDRLTKKQKEAMMFIRMMDVGGFIEGVGGRGVTYEWTSDEWKDVIVFVLDC